MTEITITAPSLETFTDPDSGDTIEVMVITAEAFGTDGRMHAVSVAYSPNDPPEFAAAHARNLHAILTGQMRDAGVLPETT